MLLAVVTIAAAGYVLAHHDKVPDAGQALPVPTASTRVGVAAPSSSADSAASLAPNSAASSSGAHQRATVAFLGDDWTAGDGASQPSRRFTSLISRDLHLTERNFGVAGTGYAKSSEHGGRYASRLDAVVAAHPDVVIVSGGRNDMTNFPATTADAAKALFRQLHAKLPHATLIAIAPMWGDSDLPPELADLGDAVRAAVSSVGGHYLDIADPIHGHPSYMSDDADPDDAGYAAIARALEPALRALLAE